MIASRVMNQLIVLTFAYNEGHQWRVSKLIPVYNAIVVVTHDPDYRRKLQGRVDLKFICIAGWAEGRYAREIKRLMIELGFKELGKRESLDEYKIPDETVLD